MFLEGDYDAMVNYECLIIQANNDWRRVETNRCMWYTLMTGFLLQILLWGM